MGREKIDKEIRRKGEMETRNWMISVLRRWRNQDDSICNATGELALLPVLCAGMVG
ncbi:MAG: hypothetical protein ABIL44_09480 [candidate division WOR-3 bacterium]